MKLGSFENFKKMGRHEIDSWSTHFNAHQGSICQAARARWYGARCCLLSAVLCQSLLNVCYNRSAFTGPAAQLKWRGEEPLWRLLFDFCVHLQLLSLRHAGKRPPRAGRYSCQEHVEGKAKPSRAILCLPPPLLCTVPSFHPAMCRFVYLGLGQHPC